MIILKIQIICHPWVLFVGSITHTLCRSLLKVLTVKFLNVSFSKIPPLSLWTHLFFGYCITLLSTIISRIKSHIHTHRNLGDTVAMHLCYSEQIHLAQFYPQKDKLTTVLYRGNNSNSSKEQIKYRPTIYRLTASKIIVNSQFHFLLLIAFTDFFNLYIL